MPALLAKAPHGHEDREMSVKQILTAIVAMAAAAAWGTVFALFAFGA